MKLRCETESTEEARAGVPLAFAPEPLLAERRAHLPRRAREGVGVRHVEEERREARAQRLGEAPGVLLAPAERGQHRDEGERHDERGQEREGDRQRLVAEELPGDAVQDEAVVVGDFNDWDEESHPMKYVKSRDVWKRDVSLEAGETYEFRYLVDGNEWRNDEDADDAVSTPFASENSVLKL